MEDAKYVTNVIHTVHNLLCNPAFLTENPQFRTWIPDGTTNCSSLYEADVSFLINWSHSTLNRLVVKFRCLRVVHHHQHHPTITPLPQQ